ncbi:hypothetical protein OsI_19998 [Oryza sativa Indica Group]|uniref:Uncharacterized protein n=1 Tax=Oryza sativa subsp. indica TaxID=39946 RepID=A2Y4S0_ORYSI|nr:hypothetical protein OsI_19998 [Oryza sativa Indica Group]
MAAAGGERRPGCLAGGEVEGAGKSVALLLRRAAASRGTVGITTPSPMDPALLPWACMAARSRTNSAALTLRSRSRSHWPAEQIGEIDANFPEQSSKQIGSWSQIFSICLAWLRPFYSRFTVA